MMRILACLTVLALVSGCAGVKDAVNPYEENFRCKAKDSDGKCLDTPTAYKEARLPDGQMSEAASNTSQIEAQNSRYKALTDLLEAPETPVLGQVPLPRNSSTIDCICGCWICLGISTVKVSGDLPSWRRVIR